jgi:thymidylate synthase
MSILPRRRAARRIEMVHTWESQCLPKLDVRNSATGDIGVCTLWTLPNRLGPHLELPRINIVGPLRTRTGLGWLLRGLYLHPAVRNLVLCGKDLSLTGDALLALWEEGVGDDDTLPRSGGKLHPAMDREAVDLLRRYVKLWDWRGKSLEEVGRDIGDIPSLSQEMEPRSFAPVEIPERITFPSRKTTFPLFAKDLGDGWLQLLNLTLRCGTAKVTSEGDRLAEVLNAVVTVELAGQEEALPPFFDFTTDEFEACDRRFTSPSVSVDEDYTYAERLQSGPWSNREANEPGPTNQLEKIIERLKRSHDTRSGTLVLLGPTDLDSLDDAPCVVSVTFNIVDESLYGTYVLRSADVHNAWPFDALSLVRLQRAVAERIGIPIASATFIIHSAHIYERDWERAWKTLDRWFDRPLPLQTDPSGLFLFGLDEGRARAMLITHEADAVLWEGEFRSPEDLSWYIVDVMPWLSAQHVRYIGQECANLMRALQAGEDYVQG